MTVTAALCWFDEPLWQLEDCIRGLPTVADRVVAVDGGYRRYPGAKAASPTEQADVIRKTAADVGLDCVIHVPTKVWPGQVAKRTFTLQLATDGLHPRHDWFMAVDADHIWSGPREDIRRELANASRRVDGFLVRMYTPQNPDRPLSRSAAGDWHAKHAGTYLSPQRIFRAYPDVRVEQFHWWYSAQKGNDRVWLWGGPSRVRTRRRMAGPPIKTYPQANMSRLQSKFLVEHRCLFRERKQIERNRAFCEDRISIVQKTGQEDFHS